MTALLGVLSLLTLPLGIVVLSFAANHLQNRGDGPSSDLGISALLLLGAALVAPFFGLLLLSSLFSLALFR